jgi:hypothetical protein
MPGWWNCTCRPGSRCRSEILLGKTFPRRREYKPLQSWHLCFHFLRRILARWAISVGKHAHTGGVQVLSSSTGDARRVEGVVVLAGRIAGDAFDTPLVVTQVMRVEQTRGTAGEAVGGVWRGRQVGLGEVEPGGAPASHVFVRSSSTHEHKDSGSIRRSHAKARTPHCRQHEKCGVGASLTATGTCRRWPPKTRPGLSQECPLSRWREVMTQ